MRLTSTETFSGDSILDEFKFVQTEPVEEEIYDDSAPSIEDIERAMNEIKLSAMSEDEAAQYPEKPVHELEEDPILSEFHLLKPEVEEVEVDEEPVKKATPAKKSTTAKKATTTKKSK